MIETKPRICLPDLDAVDADDPREVADAGIEAFQKALLELIGYGERLEKHVHNALATTALEAGWHEDDVWVIAAEHPFSARIARAMGAIGTSYSLLAGQTGSLSEITLK